MWPCKRKLDEEKSKHHGLNGLWLSIFAQDAEAGKRHNKA
jgi:hypothetical protein